VNVDFKSKLRVCESRTFNHHIVTIGTLLDFLGLEDFKKTSATNRAFWRISMKCNGDIV
jgi:hypothetical protein